jgi:hypothetical protein
MPHRQSVTLIDPLDGTWLSALERAVQDVYARPQYVIADARRLDAEPVGCLVNDGERSFLLPLLLRRVCHDDGACYATFRDATSPYGYPGVMLSAAASASEGFADACFQATLEALREIEVCALFVRLHPLLNAPVMAQLQRYAVTQNGLTVSIDLEQSETLMWAAMSKGHTNAINRARRAGFEIEISPAHRRIHDLVPVYAETMERLGAVSSYRFGPDHFERLAELDEAFVAVAIADGEIAGGYLFFESHGIIQMHLGGPRTQYMKPSPSHLLIYSVAVWGRARGNTVVHLGGGVGGSVDDSLFGFKAGFSPRRHAYATLRLIADQERYSAVTRMRALCLGTTPDELVNSGFFPAYRAALPSVG